MKKLKPLVIALLLGVVLAVLYPYLPSIRIKPTSVPATLEIGQPAEASPSVRSNFEIRVKGIAPSARFLGARVHECIYVSKKDESWWWGCSAYAKVDVPVKIGYSIDLSKLTTLDIEWNPRRAVMAVSVPDVGVESVEFDLKDANRHVWVGYLCSSSSGEALVRKAEAEIAGAARALAEKPDVKDKARLVALPALAQQLQKVLRAITGDQHAIVQVVVRQRP